MRTKLKCLFPTVFLIVFLSLLLSTCEKETTPQKISLSKVDKKAEPERSDQDILRVAISAIISPKETFLLYKDLLDYLGHKTNLSVQLVQRDTYAEVNELIKKRELDLAFVCSGAYVTGHDEFGMELLVVPKAFGDIVYHCYIIVPKDSKVNSLEELRGKKFAFTDPMSNTGKLAPTYMLAKMDETPESFFSSFDYTFSHDRSIESVALKLVDGAAIDGLIWEYLKSTGSDLPAKTKIVFKSEPYGIPPVVIPAKFDLEKKEKLRQILFVMHKDLQGKKILDKLLIEKFVISDDSKYDSIRKMNAWVIKK